MSCYPFLDRAAGGFPACWHQGGPCAADANMSVIGGLLLKVAIMTERNAIAQIQWSATSNQTVNLLAYVNQL